MLLDRVRDRVRDGMGLEYYRDRANPSYRPRLPTQAMGSRFAATACAIPNVTPRKITPRSITPKIGVLPLKQGFDCLLLNIKNHKLIYRSPKGSPTIVLN